MLAAISAQASEFELIYTGAFNAQEALNLASDPAPSYFTASTPFTITARFDDSGPNLAPAFGGPFDGFRAYGPSSVTIDIAGATVGPLNTAQIIALPEPATQALMLLGLAGLGWAVRRARR